MVIAAPEPKAELQPSIGERRVTLHGISWEAYLQILAALPPISQHAVDLR
jgi:hypothetical protein